MFGARLNNDMHQWLDREVGRADSARYPAKTLCADAAAFHFRDVEPAGCLIDAFSSLALADGTLTAGCTSSTLPFGRK